MSARKLNWFLGYNSLKIITEQERRHWLMKTDKKKQLIDPVTGDQYLGRLDNMGSDIWIETEKQGIKYTMLKDIQFPETFANIFEINPSAFPYNCAVPGFAFARIKSTNYFAATDITEYISTDGTTIIDTTESNHKHYRLMFKDCERVVLPFAGSTQSSDVFGYRWIRTKRAYIALLNDDGEYGDEVRINFGTTATEPVFYYPLTESLQTLPLEYDGDNQYHTFGITDNQLIGYPAFWFTCGELIAYGPRAYVMGNPRSSANNYQLFAIASEGNDTLYKGAVYVCVDSAQALPDDNADPAETYISVKPIVGEDFSAYGTNEEVPIRNEITFGDETYYLDTNGNNTKLYINNPNDVWEYEYHSGVSNTIMKIKASAFASNSLEENQNPLIPLIRIEFDESIRTDENYTTDTGVAGVRIASGNPYSDMYQKYPYDLNLWDGLPEYMTNMTSDNIPEHMAIYALHNTPAYMQSMPESKQTAALLFDLGQYPDHSKKYDFIYRYKTAVQTWPENANAGIPISDFYSAVESLTISYEVIAQAFLDGTSSVEEGYEDVLTMVGDTHYCKHDYKYYLWRYAGRGGVFESGLTDAEKLARVRTINKNRISGVKYRSLKKNDEGAYTFNIENPSYRFIFGDPEAIHLKYDNSDYPELEFNENDCYDFGVVTQDNHNGSYETTVVPEEDYEQMIYAIFLEAKTTLLDYRNNHDQQYLPALGIRILNWEGWRSLAEQPIVSYYDDATGRLICRGYVESGIQVDENRQIYGLNLLDWGERCVIDPENESSWTFTVASAADEGANGGAYRLNAYTSFRFQIDVIREINNVGRVYILSNDDAIYENNETSAFPKPARTAARICDIPTSIVQLTGISSVAPTSVVDPKYVRTDVNYTDYDKDRLYNTLESRWVRPIHDRKTGTVPTSDNDYVFTSLTDLNNVDLYYKNNFRVRENLNPRVDPNDVYAGTIIEKGKYYHEGDYGIIYVGGFGFQYNVIAVDADGGITEFSVSPVKAGDSEDKTYPNINLSNFDMNSDIVGVTESYGTSPVKGNGRGFKCTLCIRNFSDKYLMKYGDIFDDLYALVKLTDGLYMYTYNTSLGQWQQHIKLASFEMLDKDNNYQTPTDSFMASIIPRRTEMSCCQLQDNEALVMIDMLATPYFVNIIDEEKTPVDIDIPSSNAGGVIDNSLTKVDLCKLRCNGLYEYTATAKTEEAIFKELKRQDVLEADSYLLIKWVDPASDTNLKFYAGVVKRSFNNIVQENYLDGSMTLLPENGLKLQKNVNSNIQTTIVWDVPDVGPMLWIFNPLYEYREIYHIDTERRGFYIERKRMSWDDIDIYIGNTNRKVSLFTSDDLLDYTIYGHSPCLPGAKTSTPSSPIYAQPFFDKYGFWKIHERGKEKQNVLNSTIPIGNWTCVFPRVHGFEFTQIDRNGNVTKHVPIQLQAIHTNEVKSSAALVNPSNNWDESARTIILEDTPDHGVRLRAFNGETKTWDII